MIPFINEEMLNSLKFTDFRQCALHHRAYLESWRPLYTGDVAVTNALFTDAEVLPPNSNTPHPLKLQSYSALALESSAFTCPPSDFE